MCVCVFVCRAFHGTRLDPFQITTDQRLVLARTIQDGDIDMSTPHISGRFWERFLPEHDRNPTGFHYKKLFSLTKDVERIRPQGGIF